MHIYIASFRAVSSVGQVDGESLDDQAKRNHDFIEDFSRYYPGYAATLSHEFEITESRSITLLSDACDTIPAYRQLVDLIQMPKNKRKLDALVFQSWDRLARSPALITTLNELMLTHGIVPISRHNLPRTLDCEELLNDFGAGVSTAVDAQRSGNEVRELIRRHRMGMPKRLREKKLFPSHPNFGYKVVNGRIVDDPAKQAIVRLALLDLYANGGMSAAATARELNNRNIPSPGGATWQSNTIRYLINRLPIYMGRLMLNRISKTGRPPIEVEGSHNPVFTVEEAERIERAAKLHRNDRKVSKHVPLLGIVLCEVCNKPMIVYSSNIGRPNQRIHRYRMECGHCGRTISSKKLMAAVESGVALLNETSDLSVFLPDPPSDVSAEQKRQKLIDDLAAVSAERKRLVRGYVAGDVPEELFTSMSKEISGKEAILSGELEKLGDQAQIEKERQRSMDRLSAAQRDCEQMLQKLRDEEDPQEVRSWLYSFMRLYVNKLGDQNFVTKILIL